MKLIFGAVAVTLILAVSQLQASDAKKALAWLESIEALSKQKNTVIIGSIHGGVESKVIDAHHEGISKQFSHRGVKLETRSKEFKGVIFAH